MVHYIATKMKYLVVGLGNPGSKYAETRHNIGFKVVEALAKELEGSFSLQKVAEKAEVKYKGRILILVKPTTYMNLSGKAVNYYLQQEKIPKENLIVVTDDFSASVREIANERQRIRRWTQWFERHSSNFEYNRILSFAFWCGL